jgi:hypothetical protein
MPPSDVLVHRVVDPVVEWVWPDFEEPIGALLDRLAIPAGDLSKGFRCIDGALAVSVVLLSERLVARPDVEIRFEQHQIAERVDQLWVAGAFFFGQ